MDIFKELPFDLQTVIYEKYETEKFLQKIQSIQEDNYVEVMDQFKIFNSTFYHDNCGWCWDLLFFTLRYEKRMDDNLPSFI
jgi:hypothetical protein